MEKIVKKSHEKSKKQINGNGISEADVLQIWNAMCYFIRDEMIKKRGVVIPGFGTFSFTETRLDLGNTKEILKIKPSFTLSDKFIQKHAVEFEKEHVNETLPVSRLNYVAVAERIGHGRYSRDTVEIVLGEAFMAIDHFLRDEGQVTVPMHQLGCLTVAPVVLKPKRQAVFEFTANMFDKSLPVYNMP
jgi:nucleoid DNA-binding protein